MDDTLDKILDLLDLKPDDKEKIKDSFAKKLTFETLSAIDSVDPQAALSFSKALENTKDQSEINALLASICKNPKVKQKIEQNLDKFTEDFTRNILLIASEEKREKLSKILQN